MGERSKAAPLYVFVLVGPDGLPTSDGIFWSRASARNHLNYTTSDVRTLRIRRAKLTVFNK